MPPYDDAYRSKQEIRTRSLVSALLARGDAVRTGRVVPEDGDLAIGAGRRFDATVMFLDICGSSGRGSDDHGAQSALLLAFSVFFAEMIRIIEDHGGTVEKNTGDGLMAYFDKGQAGRSAQTTAAMAAMTMLATAERLIDPLAGRLELDRFPFRICLDHGPITVAEVGAPRGFRGIVAIGSTANIASKMLAIADEDSIFMGRAVVDGLPVEWLGYVGDEGMTGFHYAATGANYPCYRFTGRWISK